MTPKPGANLTPRHLEVIARYAIGQQQAQVAAEMGVTVSVVKNLTRTALEELGAANNAHLVGLAIAYELLPADVATNPTIPSGGRHERVR